MRNYRDAQKETEMLFFISIKWMWRFTYNRLYIINLFMQLLALSFVFKKKGRLFPGPPFFRPLQYCLIKSGLAAWL